MYSNRRFTNKNTMILPKQYLRWNEYIQELFDDDRHREKVEKNSKLDKYPAERLKLIKVVN